MNDVFKLSDSAVKAHFFVRLPKCTYLSVLTYFVCMESWSSCHMEIFKMLAKV